MVKVSHNTKQLKAMATELQGADVDTLVTDKVRELGILATAWPVMAAFGAASQYGTLRQACEDASGGLDTVVKALGRTVDGIAGYYERMEQRYGTDFDSVEFDD